MDFREVKQGALHPFRNQGTQQNAVAVEAPIRGRRRFPFLFHIMIRYACDGGRSRMSHFRTIGILIRTGNA